MHEVEYCKWSMVSWRKNLLTERCWRRTDITYDYGDLYQLVWASQDLCKVGADVTSAGVAICLGDPRDDFLETWHTYMIDFLRGSLANMDTHPARLAEIRHGSRTAGIYIIRASGAWHRRVCPYWWGALETSFCEQLAGISQRTFAGMVVVIVDNTSLSCCEYYMLSDFQHRFC